MLQHVVVKLYNFNSCSNYEVIYCPQMIQPFCCSLRENSVCFPIPSKEEFLILPLIFLFPVITQTPNSPSCETFPSHALQSLGFLLPIPSQRYFSFLMVHLILLMSFKQSIILITIQYILMRMYQLILSSHSHQVKTHQKQFAHCFLHFGFVSEMFFNTGTQVLGLFTYSIVYKHERALSNRNYISFYQYCWQLPILQGFTGGSVVKNPSAQSRRHGFHRWVRKIPWRREWQPTPVFLPWEIPWTKELGGPKSKGLQKSWSQLTD